MSEILERTGIDFYLDPPPPSLSETFHENTKLQPAASPNAKRPAAQYSFEELTAMLNARKHYPNSRKVPLPEMTPTSDAFHDVVGRRRSIRSFSLAAMTLQQLSSLLSLSYGVTSERPHSGGHTHRYRAAPSAGALYPAEIYLFARNVRSLPQGLYHFAPEQRLLVELSTGDHTPVVWEACCRQDYVKQAAITVFITGVFQRTKRKYGERGYRYVLLDVGHLGQNLCLAATANRQAVMTTCGFFDDQVNELIGIDGLDEAALYAAFIGPSGDDQTEHRPTD